MTALYKLFSEQNQRLAKPGNDIAASVTDEKLDLWHMGTGVVGEAGELIDVIKKHVIYNKDLDIEHLIEELGDLEFYLEGVRRCTGITREQCLRHNLEKLSHGQNARYASGQYSDQQAQDRADKTE